MTADRKVQSTGTVDLEKLARVVNKSADEADTIDDLRALLRS